MSLEKYLAGREHEWRDGGCFALAGDGYWWKVAEGTAEKHTITADGRKQIGVTVVLANTSTVEVESPKRGKKPAKPELDLDDL